MSLRRNKLANASVLSSEERVGRSEHFRVTMMLSAIFPHVIPAQAGIHSAFAIMKAKWIPACAGMTEIEAA
jgi:hypothetical protein